MYEEGFVPGGYGEGCSFAGDDGSGYVYVVVGLWWLSGAVEEDAEHYRRHDNNRQQAAISRTTTVNVFENEVEYVCCGE